MEGFRPPKGEKETPDPLPREVAFTLEELKAREAKLERPLRPVPEELPVDIQLSEDQEQDLKDTIKSLLEK